MADIFNRRRVIKGIASGSVAVALAGCGGSDDDGNGNGNGGNGNGGNGNGNGGNGNGNGGNGNGNGGNGGSGSTTNVGMIYSTGGLGDNSFNDSANRGIQSAAEDFNVEFTNAEPEQPSEFATFQQQFATSSDPNYDLIFTIGFSQKSALQDSASQFADQKFTIIDSTVDASNVASYVFKEHEGSFQAGVMAGHLTSREFSGGAGETKPDQNVIGFVGGKETPLIKKFEAGYRFGANEVNSDIQVNTAYVGDWTDPDAGQSAAESMYDNGADIVYHAAGGTGVGVIQAAQERGRYAIGVDARQSVTLSEFSDSILGSMVKRVNEAVYNSVENVVNDEFGGGEVQTLGLNENGVALVYGTDLESQIPQDIKDAVTSQSERVTSGDLTVPSSVDDL